MTEKLFTGTLNHNQNKKIKRTPGLYGLMNLEKIAKMANEPSGLILDRSVWASSNFICLIRVLSVEKNQIMILSFRTDGSGLTVQRSSLIRVFTVCYSICIFLTKYAKVWPLCLNFR